MEFSETASLTTEPATGRHKFFTGIIAVAVSLAAAAAWYSGGPRLPPMAAFLPSCGTAVSLADLMTALLLFSQLRLTRVPAEAFLASAYLFTGLMVIVQLLVFPAKRGLALVFLAWWLSRLRHRLCARGVRLWPRQARAHGGEHTRRDMRAGHCRSRHCLELSGECCAGLAAAFERPAAQPVRLGAGRAGPQPGGAAAGHRRDALPCRARSRPGHRDAGLSA